MEALYDEEAVAKEKALKSLGLCNHKATKWFDDETGENEQLICLDCKFLIAEIPKRKWFDVSIERSDRP